MDIQITNIYTDVKWYAPQTKIWAFIKCPLHDGENATMCIIC